MKPEESSFGGQMSLGARPGRPKNRADACYRGLPSVQMTLLLGEEIPS